MGNEVRVTSGKLIRASRRRMGLSQNEVATLADVSRRTVQSVESGNPSVKLASLQAIGDVLNLDLREDGTMSTGDTISNVASFGYWPFRLFKFVSARVAPSNQAFCTCERDFRSALETMWQNLQHGLAKFCPVKAKRMAEVHPDFCSKQGYLDRYLGIWRVNPKAFAFSSRGDQRTGVSIVLPVADSTFEQFVSGQRGNFGLQADEILPESSTVIYESIAPFFDSRTKLHSLNESLAFVAINHLSHVLPCVRTYGCDIASFGAHDENIDRMRRVGLKPIGTEVPGLQFPIWQISNRSDFGLNEDEQIRSSTTIHFMSLRQKAISMRAKLVFGAIGATQANRIAASAAEAKKHVA